MYPPGEIFPFFDSVMVSFFFFFFFFFFFYFYDSQKTLRSFASSLVLLSAVGTNIIRLFLAAAWIVAVAVAATFILSSSIFIITPFSTFLSNLTSSAAVTFRPSF